MNTQPINRDRRELCRAAIMRTMRRVQAAANEQTESTAFLYLYRHRETGRYLASRKPLTVRAAELQPQFDGKPAPAVVCAAFIRQYGRI